MPDRAFLGENDAPRADDLTPSREAETFVLRLARVLHQRGTPAPRLEAAIEAVASAVGVRAQVFSAPTALQVGFGPDDAQRVHLLRTHPSDIELGKLDDLDGLISELLSRSLSLASANERLEAIESAPPVHARVSLPLAFSVTGAAAACLLGGGLFDAIVGSALALMIGILALWVPRVQGGAALFEPGAALLVSFAATLLSSYVPLHEGTVTMSALIVLIPGLTFTVAISELAAQHLASGTARLAGALTTFLTMAFGVAVGRVLALRILGDQVPPLSEPATFPSVAIYVALPAAAVAFIVLFGARWRHLPAVAVVGAIAFFTTANSATLVGPELAAFVGALALGLASNAYARLLQRPASLPLVPGLLLLVPGTVGFRSTTAFLAADAVSGADAAFDMAITGTALAAGMLVAHLVLSSRRYL